MNSKIEVSTLVQRLPTIEKNIKPPKIGLGKKWAGVFDAMENGDSIVVTSKERRSISSWKWLLPFPPKIMTRNIGGGQYRVWLLKEWSIDAVHKKLQKTEIHPRKEEANDTCV
tara:strand:+ start:1903 stop:2241 length:339 start_codon:yes stop_codon:yes gene_type:complete